MYRDARMLGSWMFSTNRALPEDGIPKSLTQRVLAASPQSAATKAGEAEELPHRRSRLLDRLVPAVLVGGAAGALDYLSRVSQRLHVPGVDQYEGAEQQ